jgi:mono/diheme cytochrome c family protein
LQKRGGMPLRTLVVPLMVMIAALQLGACARHGAPRGSRPTTNVPGADLARGKTLFVQQCAACHGIAGMGGEIGPSLVNERARRSFESVRAFVNDPPPPMPKLYPSRMTQADIRDVSAYVETL